VRARWPGAGRYIRRALALVRRRPWRAALASRFAFGLRLALPVACGAARVRLPLFLGATAISSFLWSVLFTALGWMFGETAMTVIGHVRRNEDKIAAAIIAVLVAIFLVVRRRREAVGHAVEEVVLGEERPASG
jgi:membrane protein DedA with SNARE-associated domain